MRPIPTPRPVDCWDQWLTLLEVIDLSRREKKAMEALGLPLTEGQRTQLGLRIMERNKIEEHLFVEHHPDEVTRPQ